MIELSHDETWKGGNLALGSMDLKPQVTRLLYASSDFAFEIIIIRNK